MADEIRDEAVARVFEIVDRARAVFNGLVIPGHRRSIRAGHMFWALPGGAFADAVALKRTDPLFYVINEPTEAQLIAKQPQLKAFVS